MVTGVLLGVVVVAAALAVGGYLVTNWRFTLAREGSAWHVSRGLFTTRETSLDVARVAGVTRGEQAALRLARGGRLSAIVTGLGAGRGSSAVLVPPAPAGVVAQAAGAVLASDLPMSAPLRGHGPAAVRRRYTRALLGAVPFVAVPVVAVALGAPPWLLVGAAVPVAAALALARDRARGLGHGLVDGFVVVRSGSMLRERDALATGHVIGWTFRDTWFQRRVGLTTLSATTAGGKGAVHAPDAPAGDAVALAVAATPGLLDPFTA
ncbi:PH domain-containing protein [Nocardioides sp. TF02-7]|uniref:PH domain-containing protein n=1 Tax=Nocardioides sp. TF02-7 TaxID=2917724 RepID=UPI001F060B9E|nr:PH domain-containing protein [Nocardioides sp. TF02-7]UMG93247.1 PH domain-containing protein [Nocardioides sp. TF02-7]